jgi:hypothetical protein
VGVAFDANLGQLAGQFLYNDNTGRTISLTSQAIIEVLRKVYRAEALADELLGPTSVVPASHRTGTEN